MLDMVPLSKLVSMMPPTKIGGFGSELNPTPAATLPLTLSPALTYPSLFTSKKSPDGAAPVNGLTAMIQPLPLGLHTSVTFGMRVTPISRVPWNSLVSTMRSLGSVANAFGPTRSRYQPFLPVRSVVPSLLMVCVEIDRAGRGGAPLLPPAVSPVIVRWVRLLRLPGTFAVQLVVVLPFLVEVVHDCAMMPYQVCVPVLVRSVLLRYSPVPKNNQTFEVLGSWPASMPAVMGCTLPLASLAVNSSEPVLVGVGFAPVPSFNWNDHTWPCKSPAYAISLTPIEASVLVVVLSIHATGAAKPLPVVVSVVVCTLSAPVAKLNCNSAAFPDALL